MKVRLLAMAMAALGVLAACSNGAPSGQGPEGGSGALDTVDETSDPTAGPPPTSAAPTGGNPTATAPRGISCDQVRDAAVGAVAFPLADFAGAGLVQLSGGRYAAPDGTVIELLPACATGDVNADGSADVVGAVRIDPDGTGVFYTLVVWLATDPGTPALAGSEALGDRNPVQSIAIARGVVTVVYFTRTGDVPMAGLNIRRTATYRFAEPGLTETGHTDAACSPCDV